MALAQKIHTQNKGTEKPNMDTPAPIQLIGGPCRDIGGRRFDFAHQVAVMGIINRTKDSFHDQGSTMELAHAIASAESMVLRGADWIDIGAVPFSPHTEEVPESLEMERILPLVRHLRATSDVVISIDTYRPRVASEAIDAGADVINDTSGLRDPQMARVAAQTGALLIITHSRAAPRTHLPDPAYVNVTQEVREFLSNRVRTALELGLQPSQIIIDPGHDLNKNTLHSLQLTRELHQITSLGYPVLASVSNKDFIHEITGREPRALSAGTTSALCSCIWQGARVIRVHDVESARATVEFLSAVFEWKTPLNLRHNVSS